MTDEEIDEEEEVDEEESTNLREVNNNELVDDSVLDKEQEKFNKDKNNDGYESECDDDTIEKTVKCLNNFLLEF